MVGAISSSSQTALRVQIRPQAECIYLFSGKRRVLARLIIGKDGWLKEYFSCAFDLVDGEWQIVQNLCFAGTDGPYSGDYG
jgi:hypothetical protein